MRVPDIRKRVGAAPSEPRDKFAVVAQMQLESVGEVVIPGHDVGNKSAARKRRRDPARCDCAQRVRLDSRILCRRTGTRNARPDPPAERPRRESARAHCPRRPQSRSYPGGQPQMNLLRGNPARRDSARRRRCSPRARFASDLRRASHRARPQRSARASRKARMRVRARRSRPRPRHALRAQAVTRGNAALRVRFLLTLSRLQFSAVRCLILRVIVAATSGE